MQTNCIDLTQEYKALLKLSSFLADYTKLETLFTKAVQKNAWFTAENQLFAVKHWQYLLSASSLQQFAERIEQAKVSKNIGIVMAGNIPLVGFHDLVCVLLSGHNAVVKLSKDDDVLPRYFIEFLIEELSDPKKITIVEKLNYLDAVIATGSNNTSRYFEYYFRHIPSIIRKNRTSAAVLTGLETAEDLRQLGSDVFTYFGLGCRNVGKVFIPKGYRVENLPDAWQHWQYLADHSKFHNNYTYHKALLLMNSEPHLDNGFLLFKESSQLFSPLGCLYYEQYDQMPLLLSQLNEQDEYLQCIVCKKPITPDTVLPGSTQMPAIDTFADKVNTLEFLLSI